MTRKTTVSLAFYLLMLVFTPSASKADSDLETKFQDMFVTAGYSAAAGAAIGAALLTFQDEPAKHLKFVSIGASLGFLGGTALGSWMVLAPIFVHHETPRSTLLASASTTDGKLVFRPWVDFENMQVTGLEASAVLAKF